jgi:putative ATP-binding cassette transporter
MLAILASVISGASNAGLIALINSAISRDRFSSTPLVWTFVGLCLLLPLSRFISQVLLIHLSQKATFDLRMRLSRQILSAPLRRLEEMGPHRLLASLTEDVQVITGALVNIPLICMHAAILVGCLVYLGWLSWTLLLAVLGFMVVGVVSFQLIVRSGTRYLRMAREEQDSLFGHFRAMTEGTKELKLNYKRRTTFLAKILHSTASLSRRHNRTGNVIYTVAGSWTQFLHFALIGLVLFAAPTMTGATAQTLIGYTLILLYMLVPLDVLLSISPLLGRANVALNKVQSLGLSLATGMKEEEVAIPVEIEPDWRRLELRGVTHAYHREQEDGSFILGPINLTIEPGEVLFLVGGNGSGKTTLAKLLTGLYVPESGEIHLRDETINDNNREYYRQYFSVVFSDFYLFESLLGLSANTLDLDERARDYLYKLLLDRKVEVKDGALSTTHLSQGQRKRLALLTAYLEDRPIYVFDEWAADQDPQFKEIFYYQLIPELKARGKTVVVISHDQHYYHVADRLVRLDYGRVEYDKRLTTGDDPSMRLLESDQLVQMNLQD